MSKVIVVGAGLFGCVAAALAKAAGHQVTLFDSAESGRASPCSGNLFKRSWLTSLTMEQRTGAEQVLEKLYGVERLPVASLSCVNPGKVLQEASPGKVSEVGDGWVRLRGGGKVQGTVLVAAGVWSGELVKMPEIRRLVGASLRLKGQLRAPASRVYAPYKQVTAYNITSRQVWVGDGAAILERNWDKEQRVSLLLGRARALGAKGAVQEVRIGMRPYVPGHKNGYFKRVYKKTWVSTGGAKNGLILAALRALEFVEGI